MSEWLSVKKKLPNQHKIVSVQRGGALDDILEPVYRDGQERWVYQSGLFAGIVTSSDCWREYQ